MATIHQFTAGFSRGDAISNQALQIRRILESQGHAARIYSERRRVHPRDRGEVDDAAEYRAACRPDDVVLLHLSIGSPVNELFAELPCRKAILYHNITPPEYFRLVQPETAHLLERGRQQARALAGAAPVNLADSRYNAADLVAWGYPGVQVMPLFFDLAALRPPRGRRCRRPTGQVTVLFVGRCVPNKKLEDVLTAFAHFQRFVEPRSRMIFAGSWIGMERYYGLLQSRVRTLDLREVRFTGSISQAELNGWYAEADVFLCLSEHEGFCIPLLESMIHDVPVVAYAAAAVPETLDGAGVLVREKNYPLIAELMGEVVRDGALRNGILQAQQARVARYLARDLAAELRTHLAPLLG